ncbi:MAG TPA: DUF2393 family protein [Candidatus Acidoferrales bacterium]|nr:DUF2393 family protein [Candidatus Acidoferrales bacterium]
MEPGETSYREEKRQFPIAFAAGAVVVLLIFGGFFILTRVMHSHDTATVAKLPFGATEQSYTQNIHFSGIQLAHAANFLNQDFTYVAGTISNDGSRKIRAMEVTVEFHDPFHQVILRDTSQVVQRDGISLDAGQHRDFQIQMEHLPAEWDRQNPSIRVTGLILE